MASTYSNSLKLELMETGANANTWGNNTNTNLQTVDAFSAGYLSKSVAGSANVTLTTANADPTAESSNKVLDLNGTLTGNIHVFLPAVENNYLVYNNTAGAFTVNIAATGETGVQIDQGKYEWVYCDGTNVSKAELGTSNASELTSGTLADARLSANVVFANGATTITGVQAFTANVSFGDGNYINMGASNDLFIAHTGTASVIRDQGTGNLFIDAVDLTFRNAAATNTYGTMVQSGACSFYYANSKKIETTSGGIAVTGAITATGDITAFYTSDMSLKKDIINIDNASDKIEKLKGVYYYWTDEAKEKYDHLSDGRDVGIIAQDLEKVLPELVATREDGTKAVKYDRLCALLIEGFKEMRQEIKQLKESK